VSLLIIVIIRLIVKLTTVFYPEGLQLNSSVVKLKNCLVKQFFNLLFVLLLAPPVQLEPP